MTPSSAGKESELCSLPFVVCGRSTMMPTSALFWRVSRPTYTPTPHQSFSYGEMHVASVRFASNISLFCFVCFSIYPLCAHYSKVRSNGQEGHNPRAFVVATSCADGCTLVFPIPLCSHRASSSNYLGRLSAWAQENKYCTLPLKEHMNLSLSILMSLVISTLFVLAPLHALLPFVFVQRVSACICCVPFATSTGIRKNSLPTLTNSQ